MISKQAVLELLNETPMQASHFIALMDKINSLPSISDGWISVEADTPECGVEVLVWGNSGGMMSRDLASYKTNGKWRSTVDGELIYNVTHWQTAPEPPTK